MSFKKPRLTSSPSSSALHASLHHPHARDWSERKLHTSQLMYPLFVRDGAEDKTVSGFEPNVQWGNKDGYGTLMTHLRGLKGLKNVMLFGVVHHADKDERGSMACHEKTPVIEALRMIRTHCPHLFVAVDVCLCEYTSHGHCGVLKPAEKDKEPVVDNEMTKKILADTALVYAKAGAHMVCPSDMMDGRIAEIRMALHEEGLEDVMIMSYTSKKASSLYAPFRLAVDSTFSGHRKRYQHPVGSSSHAFRALERDISEGADVVIVKPALFYGDIIAEFAKRHDQVPVAAYVVSGEYVMLKTYGETTGTLEAIVRESHLSLVRAGATLLITYFTPLILKMLHENDGEL